MKVFIQILAGLFAITSMLACSPTPEKLKETLEKNPDILFSVIEKHPDEFLKVVNKAAREAQVRQRQQEAENEKKKRDEEFANPKKPEIQDWRAISGNKNAPVTIVEYSDFQCPFCKRGTNTVHAVQKKYGDKVRFIFKHLPLDFHPAAMPAARIFEALNNQSDELAYKWHDVIFANQGKLKSPDNGVKWMLAEAKKLGANVAKAKKDMASEEVQKRIDADIAEAQKYGFRGTPGYLINGVSLRGAYPQPEFEKVIDRHLKKGG